VSKKTYTTEWIERNGTYKKVHLGETIPGKVNYLFLFKKIRYRNVLYTYTMACDRKTGKEICSY
jgi:hypothetical protein